MSVFYEGLSHLFSLSLSPFPLCAGEKTRGVSYGFLPAAYPSTHKLCSHDLGGLEMSGEEEVNAAGEEYVSSLYVTCRQCTRMVKGKPQKGRKITVQDKKLLEEAQKLVAEFGFPQK